MTQRNSGKKRSRQWARNLALFSAREGQRLRVRKGHQRCPDTAQNTRNQERTTRNTRHQTISGEGLCSIGAGISSSSSSSRSPTQLITAQKKTNPANQSKQKKLFATFLEPHPRNDSRTLRSGRGACACRNKTAQIIAHTARQ